MQDAIIQLAPVALVGAIYAVVVFIVAKKRSLNPWLWTLGSLIPIIGWLVSGLFLLLTFLSMLDRLNELEKSK